MSTHRGSVRLAGLLAILVMLAAASGGYAASANEPGAVQLAQMRGTEPRELEPRYQPVPPEEKSWYNSSYIFGLTRGVAGSTLKPGAKAPLFVFTVPLDLVLLPFATIGGLFG